MVDAARPITGSQGLAPRNDLPTIPPASPESSGLQGDHYIAPGGPADAKPPQPPKAASIPEAMVYVGQLFGTSSRSVGAYQRLGSALADRIVKMAADDGKTKYLKGRAAKDAMGAIRYATKASDFQWGCENLTPATSNKIEITGDTIIRLAKALDEEIFGKQVLDGINDAIANNDATALQDLLEARNGTPKRIIRDIIIPYLKQARVPGADLPKIAKEMAAKFPVKGSAVAPTPPADTIKIDGVSAKSIELAREIAKAEIVKADADSGSTSEAGKAVLEETLAAEALKKATPENVDRIKARYEAARIETDKYIASRVNKIFKGDGAQDKGLSDYIKYGSLLNDKLGEMNEKAQADAKKAVEGLKPTASGKVILKAGGAWIDNGKKAGDSNSTGVVTSLALFSGNFGLSFRKGFKITAGLTAVGGSGPNNLSGRPLNFIGSRSKEAGSFFSVPALNVGLAWDVSSEVTITANGGLISFGPNDTFGLLAVGATQFGLASLNLLNTGLAGGQFALTKAKVTPNLQFLGNVSFGREVTNFNLISKPEYQVITEGPDKGGNASVLVGVAGIEYRSFPNVEKTEVQKEEDNNGASVIVLAHGDMKLAEKNAYGAAVSVQVPLGSPVEEEDKDKDKKYRYSHDQITASARFSALSVFNKEATGGDVAADGKSAVWDDVTNWGVYFMYKHIFNKDLSLAGNTSYVSHAQQSVAGMSGAGFNTDGSSCDNQCLATYTDYGKYMQIHATLGYKGFSASTGFANRSLGVGSDPYSQNNWFGNLGYVHSF